MITLSSDNLEEVQKTLCLTIKKQVRFFLGLVDYYRDHIPALLRSQRCCQSPQERKVRTGTME